VKWFKRRPKAVVSPDAVVFLLLERSVDIVKDASQTLERHLDAQQRSQLRKVEEELTFFFWFALDYWTSMDARTQEERRAFKEAFSAHWRNIAGGGHEGQVILDTLQERFIAYGQIVNEEMGDEAKFFGFGRKFSEFCGMPGNPFLLLLAPDLFTKALSLWGLVKGRQRE
jgi:hypothetical protein